MSASMATPVARSGKWSRPVRKPGLRCPRTTSRTTRYFMTMTSGIRSVTEKVLWSSDNYSLLSNCNCCPWSLLNLQTQLSITSKFEINLSSNETSDTKLNDVSQVNLEHCPYFQIPESVRIERSKEDWPESRETQNLSLPEVTGRSSTSSWVVNNCSPTNNRLTPKTASTEYYLFYRLSPKLRGMVWTNYR